MELAGGSLETRELQIGAGRFDPSQPQLRSRLLEELGAQQGAKLEALGGFCGGLNEGMWMLNDPPRSLVLKLVKCQRFDSFPTEVDKLVKLSREHPSIMDDPALAYPIKVFRCVGPAGQHRYDLIVMRRAPGQPLSDLVAARCHEKKVEDLMRIFEQLGRFLADFHKRYGNMQHGDFQPSNIFYDEVSRRFTMIDVADIGPQDPLSEADVKHFSSGLRLLSGLLGQRYCAEGRRRFEAGYGLCPV